MSRVFSSSSCSDGFVGSERHQSDTVLNAVIAALGRQRSELSPPESPPRPPVHCGSGVTSHGFLGVPYTRGPKLTLDSLYSEVVLCRDAAEVLKDATVLNGAIEGSSRDLSTTGPVDVDHCPGADIAWNGGYAVTEWGDVVSLELWSCRDYFLGHFEVGDGSGPSRELQFLPDEDVAAQLGLP